MPIVWEVQDEAERALRKRRAFRNRLRTLPGPRADEDAAELIYGELVANTVRHAKGKVEVCLEIDDNLPTLIVRDHGPGLNGNRRARLPSLYAESGRGLAIVKKLSRELHIDPAPGGGTVVRAVLPAAQAS